MLTNPKIYHIFEIQELVNLISEYTDSITFINFISINKTLYSTQNRSLTLIRILYQQHHIDKHIIDTIKNSRDFLKLYNNIDKPRYIIRFEIFKILLNLIIQKNLYTARFISSLTDCLFLYQSEINYTVWETYFIDYLNNNINLINQKKSLWISIFNLRNLNLNRPGLLFDNTLNKFIKTS